MARRRYLIAYDICDDKRLRKVFVFMKGHGTRLQYSVFICDLNERELLKWEAEIRDMMDLNIDSVVFVEIGTSDIAVHVIGAPRRLPRRGPMIV